MSLKSMQLEIDRLKQRQLKQAKRPQVTIHPEYLTLQQAADLRAAAEAPDDDYDWRIIFIVTDGNEFINNTVE